MSMKNRFKCPCCGYPTLSSKADYEICELCNWEDDGQDDEHANEVWGGPNGGYSLAEARKNFSLFMIMYSPGEDSRITGEDSAMEREIKANLMVAFRKHAASSCGELAPLEGEILRLESLLEAEVVRRVREYERRAKG